MEGLAGTGFTAEDIDTLIVEAREKASGAEGSSQAWRHGDSHERRNSSCITLKEPAECTGWLPRVSLACAAPGR